MEKGDEILRSIGLLLQKWCREGDIYGRMHSDEFVIFMKKDDFDDARFRAVIHEIARETVFNLFFLNNYLLSTISSLK